MYKVITKPGDWENRRNQPLVFEHCPNIRCKREGKWFYLDTMRNPTCTECNINLKGRILTISQFSRIDYHFGLRGFFGLDNGEK